MEINRNMIWVTAARRRIAIKDMGTSHIRNAIRRILVNPGWRDDYLPTLKEELRFRESPLWKALE